MLYPTELRALNCLRTLFANVAQTGSALRCIVLPSVRRTEGPATRQLVAFAPGRAMLGLAATAATVSHPTELRALNRIRQLAAAMLAESIWQSK